MLLRVLIICLIVCFLPVNITFADEPASVETIPPLPYFGQQIPETEPAIFAEGIISGAGYLLHGFPAFSPDGREVFWPVVPPALMHMRLTDSGWTQPQALETDARVIGSAWFSPDGRRVYFHGARPGGHGSVDIWYFQRTDSGWSEPIDVGSPPNTEGMESQPSMDHDGNICFTGKLDSVGFNRGIYISRMKSDGSYAAAELLGEKVNTSAIDYTPFIASDGSYLLFASSRPTAEESDLRLYVSFREADSSFGAAVNLGAALGWNRTARFPAVSADGRALFFLSDGSIYWASAKVIDQLRPKQ